MIYCQFCGNPLDPTVDTWPRPCVVCLKLTYRSPLPVVAVIIRAWGPSDGDTYQMHPGILLIKRGIEPYKSTWAFPGGYIDHAEDWRDAAVREAQEEVGVELDRDFLQLRRVTSTKTNHLVLFVEPMPLDSDLCPWKEHDLTTTLSDTGEQEITEIVLAPRYGMAPKYTLGVPSHQEQWERLTRVGSGTKVGR